MESAFFVGKLPSMFLFFSVLGGIDLVNKGPAYGYFVNVSKTWLITKEHHDSTAITAFPDTGVNITTDGKTHLGDALGTTKFAEDCLHKKVELWTQELNKLVTIASTQPHVLTPHSLMGWATSGSMQ